MQEYFERKALAELGYAGGSTTELPWVKARAFLDIGNEIERVRAEDHRRASRKRG